ncbi:MAG: hypothetical protein MN733_18960, partial [Nitrososphaera sp.]|nr:hypothetical protein [Nitrososphaera sp.]
LYILTTQLQRMGKVILTVACLGVLTAQAQFANFTLQVVEFNKVDIRPVMCSPHVSVEPTERTAAMVTGSDNEAILQWVSGGEAKKITIEGREIQSASALHVIVRPVTENVSVRTTAVAVGQEKVLDLLVGKQSKSGKSEARIMFFDTSLRKQIAATQTVVYTVLDS